MKLSKINSYYGPIRDIHDLCRAILESLLGNNFVIAEDVSKAIKSILRFSPKLDNAMKEMLSVVPDAFDEHMRNIGEEPDFESIRDALEAAIKQPSAFFVRHEGDEPPSIYNVLLQQLVRHFRSSNEVLNTTGRKAQEDLVAFKTKNEIDMWLNYMAKILFDNWGDYISPPEQDERYEGMRRDRQEEETEKLERQLRNVPRIKEPASRRSVGMSAVQEL